MISSNKKMRLYCNHEEEAASISDVMMVDGDANINDEEMVDANVDDKDEEMVDANFDDYKDEEMVDANIEYYKDEEMVDANIDNEEMVNFQVWDGEVMIGLLKMKKCLEWQVNLELSVDKLMVRNSIERSELMHQDPLIFHEAGKYAVWLIPALVAYAALQSMQRYLQSQSLIIVMLLSSTAALCFHVPVCWLLVFKSGLGNVGAALSIGIGQFFRLALPSTVMICLEWWSFELLVLLSGILPNPQLETSVLSICLTTITFLYTIPFGIAAAASTRVSNELGAGKPQAARLAVYAAMAIAIADATIVSAILFASRNIWGYAYSNENGVIDYVTGMAALISIEVILDSLQGVMSGIARGCGWQHLGAYVNLGAFYLVGIPVAVVLGFVLLVRGRGLWIGIMTDTEKSSVGTGAYVIQATEDTGLPWPHLLPNLQFAISHCVQL
ncbi:hypothetical protein Sjap_015143 [Stephania japonica]|uniref:Uncharacterized protein n=1 Tax=Stephania japonica TaxID=461633 RepID=A0AAP0IIJ9_9MAGN